MQTPRSLNVYNALKAEITRLKGEFKRREFSRFLADYVYERLSLLDIVALIGGEPSQMLYGPDAARLLEHPKLKAIAEKVLALMRVSEDWRTFQDLYGKGLSVRKELDFKVARESLIALPARHFAARAV